MRRAGGRQGCGSEGVGARKWRGLRGNSSASQAYLVRARIKKFCDTLALLREMPRCRRALPGAIREGGRPLMHALCPRQRGYGVYSNFSRAEPRDA